MKIGATVAELKPRRLTRTERLIGTGIALGYFAVLLGTLDLGYARDEGHYFHAAEMYNNWFSLVWDDEADVRFKAPRRLWTGQTVGSYRGIVVRYEPNASITMRVNYEPETFRADELASVDLWRPTHPRARVQLQNGRAVVGEVDGTSVRTFYGVLPLGSGATIEPGINAFAKDVLRRPNMWGDNPEHPVLMKTLFALSWRYLHERWGWMSGGNAHRVPTLVVATLLAFAIFAWCTQLVGLRAGVFGALAFVTMPHAFFNAHLDCFDIPITAIWFFVAYAYWRSLWSPRWAIACGALFGLALATKLNAFFLPFVLLLHYVARYIRDLGLFREQSAGKPVACPRERNGEPDGTEGEPHNLTPDARNTRIVLPPIPIAFIAMAILGPLIFFGHWPLMWHDTINQLTWYIQRHTGHEHYDAEFLGHLLYEPPWPSIALLFPFVMSFFTVPIPAVVFGALGFLSVTARVAPMTWLRTLIARVRAKRSTYVRADTVWFFIWVNALIPFVIIALPSTPKFGGTKHWLPAMPFVAILAALGLSKSLALLEDHFPRAFRRRTWLSWVVVAFMVAPGALAIARSHPNGTSYFNTFAGGLNGSGRIKTQRQFWGYASRQVLDWLNKHAKPGAQVCTHKMNSRSWEQYRRDGLVRRDIVTLTGGGPQCDFQRADFLLYHWQKAFADDELDAWHIFGKDTPEFGVYLDGETITAVYEKKFRFEPEGIVTYGFLPVGRWDQSSVVAMRGSERCEGARGEAFDALYERCFGTPYPRVAAHLQ